MLLKLDTEFDHVMAHRLQMFKVKGQRLRSEIGGQSYGVT